jgi:NADPH:quinone reductase-like Zn-dependent oxidoreductase
MADQPKLMQAVLLTGHGGYDRLQHRDDVPVPRPGAGEVLVQVLACGLNNTDINTRIGWYSSEMRGATGDGAPDSSTGSGGWTDGLVFPRIQGADVCGLVVAAGPDGEGADLLGQRVLIDPWVLDPDDPADRSLARYFGSELDGGFAEYCVAPTSNVYSVISDLSATELATFACSSVAAENMMAKGAVGEGDVVVITGASGGVGTAAVQLARARGAHVIAVASNSKAAVLLELGADTVVDRSSADLAGEVRAAAPSGAVDVLADVVGGSMFELLVPVLRQGGCYITAGAIAGPIVEFDLRHLIYGDLRFEGATVCPPGTFANVVAHIESGALRPVLAATYPLRQLIEAQQAFVAKRHVGNIVVEMPSGMPEGRSSDPVRAVPGS